MRIVLSIFALFLLIVPAAATPADYCEAYARDFADAGKRDEAVWRQRFDDAKGACLLQFTPAVIEAPQPKIDPPKVKPEKPVSQPVQQASVAAKKPAAQKVSQRKKKKPDLEEGSDDWLDYCDRKYASFDRDKGTYMSRTGVERKCLVTAE